MEDTGTTIASTNSTWNVSARDLENGTSGTAAYFHLADSSNVNDLASLASTNIDGSPITVKSLGAYYNYCAASAGVACSANMQDADEDICPAGWRTKGKYGYWWISEVMSPSNAYYGMLTASSTMTINNVARGMRYSIRCVLANI